MIIKENKINCTNLGNEVNVIKEEDNDEEQMAKIVFKRITETKKIKQSKKYKFFSSIKYAINYIFSHCYKITIFKIIIIIFLIIIFLLIALIYLLKIISKENSLIKINIGSSNEDIIYNKINITEKKKAYENEKFAILRNICQTCGLFSFYIYYLGCVDKYISLGYIPIVDLMSFPNAYNNYSSSCDINPWEYLFEQPFRYNLKEVLKNKKYIYRNCIEGDNRPRENSVYFNKILIDYWHDVAMKYIPIKNEIIKETKIVMKELFKGSKNVLGVKIRGTDYIANHPHGHPICPKVEDVIIDVKNMDKKYKYDYIFFASEDDAIKEKFIKQFEGKIKCLNANLKLNYNYREEKGFLINKKEITGNLDYAKNYVMNIYILTQCIDIVMSRGSGPAGIIILTNGYRNSLIYNLGEYP